ncbi:MAG: hypothetical protein HY291_01440 [Planctomycetes bacterium]|nr:hypothetical protein [Planctomycetota bacterium]
MESTQDLRALAALDWTMPELHRTSRRKRLECAGGWWILAHDREGWDYFESYRRSMTPVQLVRRCLRRGVLSVLTPCAQTEGRFELYANGATARFCCYRCACRRVWDGLDILLPKPEHWMVYMLLDSIGYLEDPAAPHEPARRERGDAEA